jgi:hypothetical protein
MPTKTSKSKASEGKPNALQKPLQPSEELAAVVGTSRMSKLRPKHRRQRARATA